MDVTLSTPTTSVFALAQAPGDAVFTIASVACDPDVAHRMMTLGWRQGEPVRVMQKAAGGAKVIDLGGSRIAVSAKLARTLLVEAST